MSEGHRETAHMEPDKSLCDGCCTETTEYEECEYCSQVLCPKCLENHVCD